jgi:ribosome modulation factor
LGLPQELRDQVYDILAEQEDLSSLMHTCRQFRFEIRSRLPGGTEINYIYRSKYETLLRNDIWRKLDIAKVKIIAEPWYSPGSALKFEVEWDVRGQSRTCHRTSRWTIRDLSSPMARYIYLYEPRLTEVTFVAATSGYFAGALHLLRAKVFDICRILTNLGRSRKYELGGSLINHKLRIHFQGRKHPEDPNRLRKSFWEMRTGCYCSTKRDIRERRWVGEVARRGDHRCQDWSPFYYEYLMLPLFSCPPWLPSAVTFDIDPAMKRSSFRDDMAHLFQDTQPYGAKQLFEQVRRYYFTQLRQMGYQNPVRGKAAKLWPYQGLSQAGHWWRSVKNTVKLINYCMRWSRDGLEGVPRPETEQLRAYLLRMRHAPGCNPFAGDYVASSKLPTPDDPVAPQNWPLRGEHPWLRSTYIEWAEDNHCSVCGANHPMETWDYKRTEDFVLYESLQDEPIGAMFNEELVLPSEPWIERPTWPRDLLIDFDRIMLCVEHSLAMSDLPSIHTGHLEGTMAKR